MVIGKTGSEESLQKSEAYQCGWVYITLNYECPPTVNISKFISNRTSSVRKPPRSVFFCILRDEILFLHESEEKVTTIQLISIQYNLESLLCPNTCGFLHHIYFPRGPLFR
jgi:hypothetical protein